VGKGAANGLSRAVPPIKARPRRIGPELGRNRPCPAAGLWVFVASVAFLPKEVFDVQKRGRLDRTRAAGQKPTLSEVRPKARLACPAPHDRGSGPARQSPRRVR
jgi:hypothetical protein